MGNDKAALALDGASLLERSVNLAKAVTGNATIIGSRQKFGSAAIEDIHPDRGPLGGIHAALTASSSDLNLILAVDTPFISEEFLRFLVREGDRCATVVTVPYVGERYQTLCAVYRRDFLSLADRSLRTGQNKIDPLFCQTTVRRIDEQELIRLAFDPRMFDNLNTPEDFARAQDRR
jgi:molybdopterin-guanine dinucleotide biosynthesis protein A